MKMLWKMVFAFNNLAPYRKEKECGLKRCGEDKSSHREFSAESEEAFNQGILLYVFYF